MTLEVSAILKYLVMSSGLLLISTFSELFAQPYSIKEITNKRYALENLLDGIKSENDGVKRSSIYFVGKYKIADAEDLLIEQLNKEQNPSNKILIALVLYKLGSENGLLTIKKLAATDDNLKVRTMSTIIYNEYLRSINKRF